MRMDADGQALLKVQAMPLANPTPEPPEYKQEGLSTKLKRQDLPLLTAVPD